MTVKINEVATSLSFLLQLLGFRVIFQALFMFPRMKHKRVFQGFSMCILYCICIVCVWFVHLADCRYLCLLDRFILINDDLMASSLGGCVKKKYFNCRGHFYNAVLGCGYCNCVVQEYKTLH